MQSGLREATLECLTLVFLAALPALFFWQIFTSYIPDLATIGRGDFTDIHYPYRLFLARSMALGDTPFWNPYVVAGHASLGDIQFQAFYPISWLVQQWAGLDFNVQTMETIVAAHFSLAAIFTYLFARRLMPGRLGPIVAALAFTYGGYLTSFPVEQVIILQVSVWLPLILLLLEMGLSSGKHECFILAGIAVATAILAGHPQTVAYVAVATALYGGFRLWDIGFNWHDLLGLLVLPIIGVGLAAVQLIPSFQHLQLTARTEVSFAFSNSGFALREVLGIVLPSELGGRPLYVGLLTLTLAAIALVGNHRTRARVFWALVALIALLVSFGGNAFAQPALYATVPVLKFFRNHERAAFLFNLAMALLAAYGASDLFGACRDQMVHLTRRALGLMGRATVVVALVAFSLLCISLLAPEANRAIFTHLTDRAFFSLVVLGGIVGLLGLAARPHGGRIATPVLVIGLIVFDLFSTNWQNNLSPITPTEAYPTNKAIELIQNDKSELFRVASEGLLPAGGNAGLVYGLYDIVGNSPLELDTFHRFDEAVPEWQRWRLLNVRYVLTKRQLDDGRLQHLLRDGDINLYEIDEANRLPRAYMVNTAIIASSPEQALEEIKTIDPLRQVVLTSVPNIALPNTTADGAKAEVEITRYSNGEIEARVSSPSNGILVLSEAHYPGWLAEVDGQATDVLAANYLLRAIAVPAGDHVVRLTFEPPGLAAGSAISLITLVFCIIALPVVYLFRRRFQRDTRTKSN